MQIRQLGWAAVPRKDQSVVPIKLPRTTSARSRALACQRSSPNPGLERPFKFFCLLACLQCSSMLVWAPRYLRGQAEPVQVFGLRLLHPGRPPPPPGPDQPDGESCEEAVRRPPQGERMGGRHHGPAGFGQGSCHEEPVVKQRVQFLIIWCWGQ